MSCTDRRKFILAAAASLAGFRLASGEQEPTFSTSVKVVNILATVRDKKGHIVRDLTKNDFTVFENGRTQNIRYFAQQSDLPLTLALLVDTSLSQTRVLEEERNASLRFLEDVLREDKDRACIVDFAQSIVVRQELTSSRKDLEAALEVLETPDVRQLGADASGTLLYEAVRNTSIQIMRKVEGRKALIVLTDGVDVGSQVTLGDAIDAADRADTLVYSILFSDENAYGAFGRLMGVPDGRGVLQRLSRETGGRFFEVSKNRTIEQIYSEIQDELRSQYSLGYVSNQPVTASGFRRIRVTVKERALSVQARDRYYAEL